MKKEEIVKAVETAVAERGCFIVDVTVNAMNDVEIVLEKEDGIVDWDDCTAPPSTRSCTKRSTRTWKTIPSPSRPPDWTGRSKS